MKIKLLSGLLLVHLSITSNTKPIVIDTVKRPFIQDDYMIRIKKMVGIPLEDHLSDRKYCTEYWERRVKFVIDSLDNRIQERRLKVLKNLKK